uniref:Uncharacterized protein n=1 Tax=Trypanosoma congolense (strain IL3000) TaxID=1068625 RepID=G0UMF7_TRYCI|nr:hypothetical protein, unlikely [Trypanosoma congolense IL3000]
MHKGTQSTRIPHSIKPPLSFSLTVTHHHHHPHTRTHNMGGTPHNAYKQNSQKKSEKPVMCQSPVAEPGGNNKLGREAPRSGVCPPPRHESGAGKKKERKGKTRKMRESGVPHTRTHNKSQ